VQAAQAKKGDFVVIDLGIDTSTGLGRMFFHTLDSVAEFEAALASERTIDGLAAARARGRTGGRNPSSDRAKSPSPGRCMTRPVPMAAVAIPSSRSLPEFGVTRPTIYRHLGKTTDTAASWPAKTGHQ
ncbi:MAG: recombinase family protein, partial [Sciscionella sp.]